MTLLYGFATAGSFFVLGWYLGYTAKCVYSKGGL